MGIGFLEHAELFSKRDLRNQDRILLPKSLGSRELESGSSYLSETPEGYT